jgi:hypothetical protein
MVRGELLMRSSNTARVRRTERGAAVVELAVSLTLIVSALLIALYAGEAFLAGARAQEAEISAGWDVTAYNLHDYLNAQDYEGGPQSLYNTVTHTVASRVKQELSGMNSYAAPGTRVGRRFVLSEQSLERLDCGPFDARNLGQGIGDALLTFDGLPHSAWTYLHRGGYVSCQARARFTSPYMPRSMREGYSNRVDLLSDALKNGFALCGLGKSLQGCQRGNETLTSGFVVLTNDWGLEDGRESPVGSNDNQKYFTVGQSVYIIDKEKYGQGLREGEGGTGSQQVREMMGMLLDTEEGDYGQTSYFKFGFLNPSSQVRRMSVDEGGGQREAHLSPWDDGESRYFTNATENISRNQRSRHHYLGHPDPSFNQP